jgi:lipopolysaccharide export system protein LptC
MDDFADLLPMRPAVRPPVRERWPARLRDAAVGYLPLLLMALLAAATWWLVRNAPPAAKPGDAPIVGHEPDYMMSSFSLQRYAADGSLRLQIEGDRLRHYPDTDTLEIDRVRIRAVGSDGVVTEATAERATSTGDGAEVQLIGGAEVSRPAGAGREALLFRSEFLHAFVEQDRVTTHLPVLVRHGRSELRAGGLDYDRATGRAVLAGPVRASIQPPAASR